MNIIHRTKHISSHAWKTITAHKIIAGFGAVIIIGGGYYGLSHLNSASAETRYVLGKVSKGTLVVSVSGTGQVSASSQVDVKPKVSGDVTYVGVAMGQAVKSGAIIAQLDSRDAQKGVRDAESSLETAKLSLEKLQQPADGLSLTQAQNSLAEANESKQNAQDDLVKTYDDGFNTISDAFIALPTVISGLDSILNGTGVGSSQSNVYAYYDMAKAYKPNANVLMGSAIQSYLAARAAYDKNLLDYKNVSRYSDHATIDTLVNETYDTTKLISQALKDAKTFLDVVNDGITNSGQNAHPPAILTTHENSLQSYIGTANSNLGSVLNIKNTIKNDNDTITNADRTISERTQSLAKLQEGTDPLDLRSAQLTVTQRQDALLDAQQTLANYYVRAPFDGVIAKLDVKKGDSASSGAAVATIITTQEVATVSLNEVDIAKIKVGQKATLTFDAIEGLTITGEVVEVDAIGTVSQGVVTYNVKIAFDTQDERVKSGMSASAAIMTEVHQDVLTVPSGAVKVRGGTNYVSMLDAFQGTTDESAFAAAGVSSITAPREQTVTIGAQSDTTTEITGGLNEGDVIVMRTVAVAANAQSAASGQTGVRIPGLTGGAPGGNATFRGGAGAVGR
jgi:HlyD family secretion protein